MSGSVSEQTSIPPVLPWHDAQWTKLARARTAGRLAHALLLAGPRGVGKRWFARRLAALLLCEAAEAAPCGRCRSCLLFAAGTHPNFHGLAPEEGKRDIAVEDVRMLIEDLVLTAHYGRPKIVLMEPADALSAASVNALLKTIEEPTPNSYLLLLSERPTALPATLRSRCQILRFAHPPTDAALAWLNQRSVKPARELLAAAHGAPLRALQLAQADVLATHALWERTLEAVQAGRESPLALATRLDREQGEELLQWLMVWGLRRQRYALASAARAASDKQIEVLDRLQQDCVEALRRMRLGSAPAQLAVESVIIPFISGVASERI